MFTAILYGCNGEKHEISVCSEIIMREDVCDLPPIQVNNENIPWSDFFFINEDNYIYVFNGQILISETAPKQFSTDLSIVYKRNAQLKCKVKIVKEFVPLQSLEIVLTSGVFSGDWVRYNIVEYPQNADCGEYNVVFDKPHYIEKLGDQCFKLLDDIPENEELVMTVTEESGISSSIKVVLSPKYNIYNAGQLQKIANDINGHYVLNNDIDLSNISWKAISCFQGKLDGNGYTISGLSISIGSQNQVINEGKYKGYGLFAQLYGTVKNVTFENASIVVSSPNGNEGAGFLYAGIVAGRAESGSLIENVKVYNSKVSVERDRSEYGGIAGVSDGTISNCNVYGIEMFGNGDEGGIAGGLCGTVKNCNVYGYTDGRKSTLRYYAVNGSRSCGGIVGYNNHGTISECNIFNVTFKLEAGYDKQPNMGYIVGYQHGGTIYHVGLGDGCSYSPSKDADKMKHSYFNWGWHTEYYTDYYFSQGWGYAGKLSEKDSMRIE